MMRRPMKPNTPRDDFLFDLRGHLILKNAIAPALVDRLKKGEALLFVDSIMYGGIGRANPGDDFIPHKASVAAWKEDAAQRKEIQIIGNHKTIVNRHR